MTEGNVGVQVGDRVCVTTAVKVFHHPAHRGQSFNIEGMEGEVVEVIADWHGRTISPNYPVVVVFEGKFRVHLSPEELTVQ
jgi:hypothetical protein